MLSVLALDIRQDINELYETLKHGPNRQVLDELMLMHTLTLEAVLHVTEDPEEREEIIEELQEKLRERLIGMLGITPSLFPDRD